MKKNFNRWTGLLVAGLVVTAAPAADVTLELRLIHPNVLHMESIPAEVVVSNGGSEVLALGGGQGAVPLSFDIENGEKILARRTSEPMFKDPVEIAPGQSARLTFDLVRLYEIRQPSSFKVRASLEWNGDTYTSNREFLDVVPGLDLGTLRVRPPDEPNKRITYALRSLLRARREHLLMRVDNEAEEMCLGVLDLGAVMKDYRPQMKADSQGLVHVLYQSAPTRFTHAVFAPGPRISSIEFFTGTANLIGLELIEGGEVRVSGGQAYRGDPYAAPPSGIEHMRQGRAPKKK